MADLLSINFDDKALQAGLDELAADALAAVRPAAQAGAQVLYDEVKSNASARKKTGNLAASIYQVFSDDNSTPRRAEYHVSWNARKAPHGHLVEYGYIQTRQVYIGKDGKWYSSKVPLAQPKPIAARPFLRPAFDAKGTAALQAAKDRWLRDMAERGAA